MPESSPPTTADVPYLIADTGGGHRAAARAVAASLRHIHQGRFRPVLLDPLTGPEPWEAVTVPPSPPGSGMYSCLPEHVIGNYNEAMRNCGPAGGLWAYLFWGAEYWLLRQQQGDPRYLSAVARILAEG